MGNHRRDCDVPAQYRRDRMTLRKLSAVVTLGWSLWALFGGAYFLGVHPPQDDPSWRVVSQTVYGVHAMGGLLLLCAVVSLAAAALGRLQELAALLCALWCAAAAFLLWRATAEVDQGDVEAWLLIMCTFTCFMRWLLLVMTRE